MMATPKLSFLALRPNASFAGFVDSMTAQIGMAMEIPFEVLARRFNSSYSASRAAHFGKTWKTPLQSLCKANGRS